MSAMSASRPTPRQTLILCLVSILFAMPFAAQVEAQTLARPGWAGSGISTDLWWKHAVLYQLDPAHFNPAAATPIQGITQRLDYIRSLGIDALLLTPIQADPAHPQTHPQTLNPAYGTLDDLDNLIQSASRDHIRVLLDLPPDIPATDLPNVARFWLNRGIAGFHITGQSDASLAQAAALRKATGSYLGQRIVIGDSALPPAAGAARPPGPQLLLTPILPAPATPPAPLSAASLRSIIDASQNAQDSTSVAQILPLLATDGPALPRSIGRFADGQHDLAIARVLATILLATRGDALLYFGQELSVTMPSPVAAAPPVAAAIDWAAPPRQPTPHINSVSSPTPPSAAVEDADSASLLNWYRQLSALHHGNPAINSGASLTIDRDAQNVLIWIRKPQIISPISPPLVILCNLSANPVQLSLKSDIQRLHLRGSFLRTLLRSDKASGPMDLQSMTLPPYTAYIGELRY